MTHTVRLKPSDKTFAVEETLPILEQALHQGIVLPYGCKNGACGSCKCRVLSGTFVQGPHQPQALSPVEQARGLALICCARATSDLEIEARVVAAVGDIPIRKMPCRVAAIEKLAPDVVRLRLQLPATERLQYLAGQYVDLLLKDGVRRSYSMATAPGTSDGIELHIRHFPGGRFSDALFGSRQPAIKVRDILRLEGPLGTFFLREDSSAPVILLASGTGFAPIKAIVEQARIKAAAPGTVAASMRPMTLYWGGRRPVDLYHDALCRRWEEEVPGFSYVPVISDALPEDGWSARVGFVHRAVMADHPDLSAYEVYACGAPIVVESARHDFISRCGLHEDAFFADAFTTAADTATATG
jgi:CDP-4-dehydro-6-deoxyglucose reductase